MTVTLHNLEQLKSKSDKLTSVEAFAFAFQPSSQHLINNVETEIGVLTLNNAQLPLTINHTEYQNSYVCSPYTALVPYTLQEINKVNNALLKSSLKLVVKLLDNYLKNNDINKIVHINNWLLSTNLYPANISVEEIKQITQLISHQYPKHSIAFRSLTHSLNPELIQALDEQGYLLVPSRQVYLYDISKQDFLRKRDYKEDQKLRNKTHYYYVSQNEILDSDISRIVELYNKLYIKKYSIYNPQFNEHYIRAIMQNKHFYLEGYRNDQGMLDAIGCCFTIENISSQPIVGYDTDKPLNEGLYRLIIASAMAHYGDKWQIFNASSGAPEFKRLRGATAEIEYTAIYVEHLPSHIKRMWRVLRYLLQKVGVPILERYQL